MAQKHYLQITDDHLRAGCGLETDGQVVAQVVADPSLIAPHAPSAKTQTLQNRAFPVIDHHGPSQEMPKWAMRDSTVHVFKDVNKGLLDSSETNAVTPAVSNPTLSKTVALLIDGWFRMTPRQKDWLSTWLQLGKEKWDAARAKQTKPEVNETEISAYPIAASDTE